MLVRLQPPFLCKHNKRPSWFFCPLFSPHYTKILNWRVWGWITWWRWPEMTPPIYLNFERPTDFSFVRCTNPDLLCKYTGNWPVCSFFWWNFIKQVRRVVGGFYDQMVPLMFSFTLLITTLCRHRPNIFKGCIAVRMVLNTLNLLTATRPLHV
jgi:hypothetical protein